MAALRSPSALVGEAKAALTAAVEADTPVGWLEESFERICRRESSQHGGDREVWQRAHERIATVGSAPLFEPALPGTVWEQAA